MPAYIPYNYRPYALYLQALCPVTAALQGTLQGSHAEYALQTPTDPKFSAALCPSEKIYPP